MVSLLLLLLLLLLNLKLHGRAQHSRTQTKEERKAKTAPDSTTNHDNNAIDDGSHHVLQYQRATFSGSRSCKVDPSKLKALKTRREAPRSIASMTAEATHVGIEAWLGRERDTRRLLYRSLQRKPASSGRQDVQKSGLEYNTKHDWCDAAYFPCPRRERLACSIGSATPFGNPRFKGSPPLSASPPTNPLPSRGTMSFRRADTCCEAVTCTVSRACTVY